MRTWKFRIVAIALFVVAGLLQLIRFKIEVGSTNGTLGLINCRLLNPSWQTH